MPIYEYQCTACGHQLEAFQKFSEEPLKDCPECHKPDLQKLISSSAFHLKGGGWYVTDIRDKDKKPADATNDTAAVNKDSKAEPAAPASATPADKKTGGSSSNSSDSASG